MTGPNGGRVYYRVRLARVTRAGGELDRLRHAMLAAELEREFDRSGLGPRVWVLRPASYQRDDPPADLAACVLVAFADPDAAAEHVNVLEASGSVGDYWPAREADANTTGAAYWEGEEPVWTADAGPAGESAGGPAEDGRAGFCGTPGPYVAVDGYQVRADPRHSSSRFKEACCVATCHHGPDAPTAEEARQNALLLAAAPAMRDALAAIIELSESGREDEPADDPGEWRERLRRIRSAARDALALSEAGGR